MFPGSVVLAFSRPCFRSSSRPQAQSLGGFPALSSSHGLSLVKNVVLLGAAIWSFGKGWNNRAGFGCNSLSFEVMSMQISSDFLLNLSSRLAIARWAPIPLRLIVGYGFMQHGFAKLSKGPDAFATILQAMGVPGPHLMAWLTILVELLGGFAVILGAFVTLVSLPMIVVLLVAMFTVHLPYGFSSIKLIAVTAAGAKFGPPGYEVILLYIACLAALILGGPGPMAVDGLIGKRKDTNLR
jgi:putative oxidoreductase